MARKQQQQAADNEPKPDVRAQVVAMYLERGPGGAKRYRLADITRETSVPRATIYWILEREGIEPDRVVARSKSTESFTEVLDRLRECEGQMAVLEDENCRLRGALESIYDRLGITPAVAHKVTGTRASNSTPAAPRRRPTARKAG